MVKQFYRVLFYPFGSKSSFADSKVITNGIYSLTFFFPTGQCSSRVDVVFLVSTHRSATDRDYQLMKKFVIDIAERLGLAPRYSQAAIVLYSDSASVKARLGQYESLDEFGGAINALRHEYGTSRRFDKALSTAASELKQKGRMSVPKVILLISNGQDRSNLNDLNRISQSLKADGVYILGVGIGHTDQQLQTQLQLVTGTNDDVFMVRDFTELSRHVVKIIDRACYLIGKCSYCGRECKTSRTLLPHRVHLRLKNCCQGINCIIIIIIIIIISSSSSRSSTNTIITYGYQRHHHHYHY